MMDILTQVIENDRDDIILENLAQANDTSSKILETLSKSCHEDVRAKVAKNFNTPKHILNNLLRDNTFIVLQSLGFLDLENRGIHLLGIKSNSSASFLCVVIPTFKVSARSESPRNRSLRRSTS